MDKENCACSSDTLIVFWVIHGLNPDKRKWTYTRHAECKFCNRPQKDISERAMQRERRQLVASMKEVMPHIYARYPFLKRYLKHATSA